MFVKSLESTISEPSLRVMYLEPPFQLSVPRVGVSACLLGEALRCDGGEKRNALLTEGWTRLEGMGWISAEEWFF